LLREAESILCYVTDRRALGGRGIGELPALIQRAVAAGIHWVQIREKDLPARELLALAREAVAAAQGSATRILVNDRLDVALAAGATGVHLGGHSLPVAEVAAWRRATESKAHVPAGFLIGASCHSQEAALEAERTGADYIFFGPVFATPSKAAFGSPQGITKLTEVCHSVCIPVIAIGGVAVENAAECYSAGAAGIAAIRLFQQAPELASIVARLCKKH
jgi:thiamine-phosphate pyrophosphorylase